MAIKPSPTRDLITVHIEEGNIMSAEIRCKDYSPEGYCQVTDVDYGGGLPTTALFMNGEVFWEKLPGSGNWHNFGGDYYYGSTSPGISFDTYDTIQSSWGGVLIGVSENIYYVFYTIMDKSSGLPMTIMFPEAFQAPPIIGVHYLGFILLPCVPVIQYSSYGTTYMTNYKVVYDAYDIRRDGSIYPASQTARQFYFNPSYSPSMNPSRLYNTLGYRNKQTLLDNTNLSLYATISGRDVATVSFTTTRLDNMPRYSVTNNEVVFNCSIVLDGTTTRYSAYYQDRMRTDSIDINQVYPQPLSVMHTFERGSYVGAVTWESATEDLIHTSGSVFIISNAGVDGFCTFYALKEKYDGIYLICGQHGFLYGETKVMSKGESDHIVYFSSKYHYNQCMFAIREEYNNGNDFRIRLFKLKITSVINPSDSDNFISSFTEIPMPYKPIHVGQNYFLISDTQQMNYYGETHMAYGFYFGASWYSSSRLEHYRCCSANDEGRNFYFSPYTSTTNFKDATNVSFNYFEKNHGYTSYAGRVDITINDLEHPEIVGSEWTGQSYRVDPFAWYYPEEYMEYIEGLGG